MRLNQAALLTHARARELLRRAVAKAEHLAQSGTFAVVDDAGILVALSRMDKGTASGLYLSKAKAAVSGATGAPSDVIQKRYIHRSLAIFSGFEASFPFDVFIGQGGIPIRQDGLTIGAIATGGEIGPFVKFDGVPPSRLLVDGTPTNVEDLIVSYALGGPYLPQHGDDMARWTEAFGAPPDPAERGTGFADPPPAARQRALGEALAIADAAIAAAKQRGHAVAVAVTDRNGVPIQVDRMDGAGALAPDIAEAVAFTAASAGCRSHLAAERLGFAPRRRTLCFAPGGVPIAEGGRTAGAIGVSGAGAQADEEIAMAALAATSP